MLLGSAPEIKSIPNCHIYFVPHLSIISQENDDRHW
jgi:hypothetical protein